MGSLAASVSVAGPVPEGGIVLLAGFDFFGVEAERDALTQIVGVAGHDKFVMIVAPEPGAEVRVYDAHMAADDVERRLGLAKTEPSP